MNGFQKASKRLFDMIAASIGLVILLPAMLLIRPAILFSSKGPIIYRHARVGRHGKIFRIMKFRTMVVGQEGKGWITTARDTRVTPVGRWLRRFKLDEYPQLWNVLVGRMSMVGPRPDVPGYADRLTGHARDILMLRPGITGLATIYFRDEEKLLDGIEDPRNYNDQVIYPAKVALNLSYMEHWSLSKDIGLILVTLIPWLDRFFKLTPTTEIDALARQGISAYQAKQS